MQEDIRRHLQSFAVPAVPAPADEVDHTPHRQPLLAQNFSPLSRPFDEGRRASVQTLPPQGFARPLPRSPRLRGSVGTASSSPLSRNFAPPPLPNKLPPITKSIQNAHGDSPLNAHPLNNLSRRHTSGDIRSHWDPIEQPPLPQQESFRSSLFDQGSLGQGSAPLPSSPRVSFSNPFESKPSRNGNNDNSHLQNSLSRYSLQAASRNSPPSSSNAQQHNQALSPGQHPTTSSTYLAPPPQESGWTLPPAVRVNFNNNVFGGSKSSGPSRDNSGPSTRRSSMANIYSVLNPADTLERDEGDDGGSPTGDGGEEGRKRKRIA